MLRLRSFDRERDNQSAPAVWQYGALIAATVFLNMPFWEDHGNDFWRFCRLPLYPLILAPAALLLTTLFFVGPGLAVQAAKRPLLGVVENSLGSIPAWVVRLCCIWFLTCWIWELIRVPAGLSASFLFHRFSPSSIETGALSVVLLISLFATGLQDEQTAAKLAFFSNKLGLAILVAALIRVHETWPAVFQGFRLASQEPAGPHVGPGLSLLAYYVAPLAFLAAGFAYRLPGRKTVAMTGGMGIALPLFAAMLLVGMINVATAVSPYYRPSLNPSVDMALWGGTAQSAQPPRMLIAAITVFGAVRFGARSLAECARITGFGRVVRWGVPGCVLPVAIAWCITHPYNAFRSDPGEMSVACLTVAAAVLTADSLVAKPRSEPARRIDWVGAAALAAGLATSFWSLPGILRANPDSWWVPWLLPSYGVAFVCCLLGRTIQRSRTARCT